MSYLYLWLNVGTLLGPFVLSFDKKVTFFKEWRYLFPAIFLMALVFITWDVLFTANGIWGFNPNYLTGYYIFSLPIEEWMFFFTVPYACVFIYACVRAYFSDFIGAFGRKIGWGIAIITFIIGLLHFQQLYTSITFLFTALFIVFLLMFINFKWGRFWVAYALSTIPFLLVNGVLTGSGIESEVVWYNEQHIMSLRIFTIPVEDSVYNMLMLLITIFWYDLFKEKKLW
jgi:lycopene cyclase domain-containing protein